MVSSSYAAGFLSAGDGDMDPFFSISKYVSNDKDKIILFLRLLSSFPVGRQKVLMRTVAI